MAAGEVTCRVALVQAGVLLVFGVALCLAAGKPGVLPIAVVYMAVNLAYTLGTARRRCWTSSARVGIRPAGLVGLSALSAAPPSAWLLLCTLCLALFLGFTKRRATWSRG